MYIIVPLLALAIAIAGVEMALLCRAAALLAAARWLGVEVKRINVGVGWALATKTVRGLPIKIRCLPLGIFVSVPAIQVRSAWRFGKEEATWWRGRDRFVLSLAALLGAFAALALGIAAVWAIGMNEPKPEPTVVVGSVPEHYVDAKGSEQPNPEWAAGLRAGDKVIALNGEKLSLGWRWLSQELVLSTGEVTLRVNRSGQTLNLRYTPAENPEAEGLRYPFFEPREKIVVTSIDAGGPAEEAGVQKGDVICSIADVAVPNVRVIQEQVQKSAGKPLELAVERDGKKITIPDIQPKGQTMADGKTKYLIGITLDAAPRGVQFTHPNPWHLLRTALMHSLPFWLHRGSFVRAAHPRHMSGPIGVLQAATHRMAEHRRLAFVGAIVSSVALVWFACCMLWPFTDAGRACLGFLQMAWPREGCLKAVIVLLCLLCLVPTTIIVWGHMTHQSFVWLPS